MTTINFKNMVGANLCVRPMSGFIFRPMANFSIRVFTMALAIMFAVASCDKSDGDLDAPAFTEFSFFGQRGASVIDAKQRTVTALAECGTNIAALTPEFTLSPTGVTATVDGKAQTGGTSVVNFSEPVTYVLTSADGQTTKEWTVTIALPDDCPQVAMKAATIHYQDSEGNDQYLCFDNYGRQRRWEAINQDGDWGIFIYDEINEKYHVWSSDPDGPGWLPDQFVTASTTQLVTAVFLSETHQFVYTYYHMIPGATKTAGTIAGQTCDIYSIPSDGNTAIFGVWENTVLLRLSENGGGLLEAVSAKRGCPDNAFSKTVNIDWN